MTSNAAPDPDKRPEPGRRSFYAKLWTMLHVRWWVIVLLVLLGLLGGATTYLYRQIDRPGPLTEDHVVIVPKGAGLVKVAGILEQAGVIHSNWLFATYARYDGGARNIKFGEYAIPAGASMSEILRILERGKVIQHRLTFPEGLSSREIVAILNASPKLEGEITEIPAEGSILPETYFYTHGESRAVIIERMKTAMTRVVDAAWGARPPGFLLKDTQELVTLAAIIEKETAVAAERPRVAAVFLNRIRLGMRLQSDPTVIYGITGGGPLDRSLTRADLDNPTPYNTYAIPGLPPGPIANPGRDSIIATVTPMATKDLYFVADGKGGHAFAETLDQHNRNVRRWRMIERGEDPDAVQAPRAAAKKKPVRKRNRN